MLDNSILGILSDSTDRKYRSPHGRSMISFRDSQNSDFQSKRKTAIVSQGSALPYSVITFHVIIPGMELAEFSIAIAQCRPGRIQSMSCLVWQLRELNVSLR